MGKTYRRENRSDRNKKKSREDRKSRKRAKDDFFTENSQIFTRSQKTKRSG
jgi:hypothetical protein